MCGGLGICRWRSAYASADGAGLFGKLSHECDCLNTIDSVDCKGSVQEIIIVVRERLRILARRVDAYTQSTIKY
jgi:hypothetical protein